MHPRRHAHAGVVARARIDSRGSRARDDRGPSADPGHASARRLAPNPRRPNRRRERAQPVRRPPGRCRRRVREVPAGRVRRVRPRIRLGLVRRRRRRLFSRRHSWRGSRGRRGRRLARGRRRGVPRGGRGSERREHRERPAVTALSRGGARRVHPPPSRARGQRRRRVDRSRRRRRSRCRPRTRIRPQGGGARRGESKVERRHAAAADGPHSWRPLPPRHVRQAPVRGPRSRRDSRLRVQPRGKRGRPARAVDAGGCRENDALHPAQRPSPRADPRDPRRCRRDLPG